MDQDGEVVDIFLQEKRDTKTAKLFFKRLIKSRNQAQRFLTVHAAVYNSFNLGCHLTSAQHFRAFRQDALLSLKNASMV